jgi:beta-galactosidase
MFFQWRASVSGSEKFHSAMVPHVGENSRIFRNVKALGGKLKEISTIAAQDTHKAEVAMVFDYQSWWALSQRNLPSTSIDYPQLAHDWYGALWELGIRVDFVSPDVSPLALAEYRAVLMPMTYLLSEQQERKFSEYADQGGSLVVSYFTGISNENDTVKLGGYGGSLVLDSLGVLVEEFAPVAQADEVLLSNGFVGSEWAQFATVVSASVEASFSSGVSSGSVAIAKASNGRSWYVGTRLNSKSALEFFDRIGSDLSLTREGGGGIEVIRRGDLKFAIDHNLKTVQVS